MASITPNEAVCKDILLKQFNPNESDFERFKSAFTDLKSKMAVAESELEDVHEDYIINFLKESFYKSTNEIKGKKPIDLAIFSDAKGKGNVQVIIEVKRVAEKDEFPTLKNINVKALHEAVLYYMRESVSNNNNEVRRIVITNAKEWYVFDARDFERFFVRENNVFKTQFENFEKKVSTISTTKEFYEKFATPAINRIKDDLNYVYFDIDKVADNELLTLFKIFSPYYLLKIPCATDSNTLNKDFYNELLYIIGLCEKEIDGKKVIERLPEKERQSGSLIENAIVQLGYDSSHNLFDRAIQLVIIWINRILFLKLLEAQLVKWHNESYKFLTPEKLKEYDTLKKLFFGVLARRPNERDPELTKDFQNIPYLNSSLFEKTEELSIADLADDVLITVYKNTVLRDIKKGTKMKPLEYLLRFLDAYDFGSVKSENGLRKESKTLINASVLGLIFEKINGYKEGSFYTPGTITQYMCKKALERAVVQKFNEVKEWKCINLTEVNNQCIRENVSIKEINDIINSLRICDPAVGSGHFLVSALNEIISIKRQLNALCSPDGALLPGNLRVENDELFVTYANGDDFSYNPKLDESQKIQKTLFNEKRTIIENCLFGVDINPNSVNICRLRLWVELLKNAYYNEKGELETLPNIDINIKCGNSLISKYPIKIGQSIVNEEIKNDVLAYKEAVAAYKKESDKQAKHDVERKIATIKTKLFSGIQYDLFDDSVREKAIAESAYRNSLEWMIEFPEVLDEKGNFLGFDVVIGNPPYISTKGVADEDKKMYEQKYGFSEDLYYIFTARGLQLVKNNGTLNFIIPKTFWTIQTKRKMRDLILGKNVKYIFDAGNPFEDASVDTCIIQIDNSEYTNDNTILFYDGSKDLKAPTVFDPIKQSVYLNTQNEVIFKPTEKNLKIWNLYSSKVKKLYDDWWKKIESSEKITQNESLLEQYRAELKPGDVALLGCLTDGGVGLQTGDNGRFIAVRKNTKNAASIIASRPKKLADAMKRNPVLAKEIGNINPVDYLANLSELQIAQKFDELKEKYGRDIFGQGYIFKIVDDSEIANVETLSDDEKENGISTNKIYIPYDKGDREGNRWYAKTPYAIAWSKENVLFLKTNSGKKGSGMPVVRNPQFYFKEGFCWNLINGTRSENDLKFKYSMPCVNDVGGMTLHARSNKIPAKYIICIGNSDFASRYTESFVNFTVNFQINDCRQIPIIIPTDEQLNAFNKIFDEAYRIKESQFSNTILETSAIEQLEQIQIRLNELVDKLYRL